MKTKKNITKLSFLIWVYKAFFSRLVNLFFCILPIVLYRPMGLMLWLLDFTTALQLWVTIWFKKDEQLLERELMFINQVLSDKRKAMLPYRLIAKAYKTRGIK